MKAPLTFLILCAALVAVAGPTMPKAGDIFVIRAFSPDTDRVASAEARIQRSLTSYEQAGQPEALIYHVSDMARPHGVIVLKDRTVYLWRLWGRDSEYLELSSNTDTSFFKIEKEEGRTTPRIVQAVVTRLDGSEPRPTVTLTNVTQIVQLAGFFPDLMNEKETDLAGGWEGKFNITFKTKDGRTIRVTTSHDGEDWSSGKGDKPLKPGLSAFVEPLFRRK